MIKALIFDLDGTLLNTLDDLRNSTNYALALHGYPTRSLDEVRQMVGNGVGKLIERATPDGISDDDLKQTLADFRRHYQVHAQDQTRPYDGILPMLRQCKDAGLLTAIVSNKPDEAVQLLAEHFFSGLIDAAVGETSGMPRKPAPDMVEKALRLLCATKQEAVYIGDSDTDFQTARNAQLPCVSVLWGFRTRQALEAEGASCFIDSPEQLLPLIQNQNL